MSGIGRTVAENTVQNSLHAVATVVAHGVDNGTDEAGSVGEEVEHDAIHRRVGLGDDEQASAMADPEASQLTHFLQSRECAGCCRSRPDKVAERAEIPFKVL